MYGNNIVQHRWQSRLPRRCSTQQGPAAPWPAAWHASSGDSSIRRTWPVCHMAANMSASTYDDIDAADLRVGYRQRPSAQPHDAARSYQPRRDQRSPDWSQDSRRSNDTQHRSGRRDPTMSAILDSKSIQQLSDALSNNEPYVMATHQSAALNVLAKLPCPPPSRPQQRQLLAALLSDICNNLPKLNTRSVVSALWAIAKLKSQHHKPQVQVLLTELLRTRRGEPDGAALATMGWALGNLQYDDATAWTALLNACLLEADTMTPLACAQLAVGLARRAQPTDPHQQLLQQELLATLAQRSAATLHEFTPQNTSNMLWALASLGAPAPELCALVSETLSDARALARFKPQELASLAWGYARLAGGRGHRQRRQQQQQQGGSDVSGSDSSGDSGSGSGVDGAASSSDAGEDWLEEAFSAAAEEAPEVAAAQLLAETATPAGLSPLPGPASVLRAAQAARGSSSSSHHSSFCAALAEQAAARGASSFRTEELVMLSWAVAKLGQQHRPAGLLDQIADVAISRRAELALKEMCCISWALANLGHHRPDMLKALIPHALDKVSPATYQEALQLLFACAKAKQPCPELCAAWKAAALPALHTATSKQLAMALWSLAQLDSADEATFRAASRPAQRHVSGCAPAYVSLLASAMGTAGHLDPLLMLALTGEVKGRLGQLPPEVVAITVWSAARVGFYCEDFSGRVAALATAGAAAAAAAAAAAGGSDGGEGGSAQAAGMQQQPGWTAHDLSTAAWALASLRHYDSLFLNALAAHVTAHMEQYSWTDLTRVAYTFAVLQHHNQPLLAAIARAAVQRQASIDRQGACLMAWSLATLGHVDRALFGACYGFYEGLFRQRGYRLGPEDEWAPQLFHADMMVQLLEGEGAAAGDAGAAGAGRRQSSRGMQQGGQQDSGQQQGQEEGQQQLQQGVPGLSVDLQRACFQAWRRRLGQLHISDAQQQVAQVLSSLGLTPLLECPAHQGLLSVDVLLCLKSGERVALEVDGPAHFAANVQSHVLGPTAAKARCLQALGYTLVTVPYFEWDALGSWQARKEYLAGKLKGRQAAAQAGLRRLPGGFTSRQVVSRRPAVLGGCKGQQ